MKTLKFEHNQAMLIRQGQKTATWRIFDDKDIHVNDSVDLVDKVDPQNPASWVSLGRAHVTMIVEKRLGDIRPADFEGHEQFESTDLMLEHYQKYYGPDVMLTTPIKMIHFELEEAQKKTPANDDIRTTLREIKMYADGGSRGNPGPSASGYVLLTMDDKVVVEKGIYLGITTNNQAEYHSLKAGLEDALKRGASVVHVYMDSMLVVNQMRGIFKVKNRDLWPVHVAIKEIVASFKEVTFTHVPRELNKLADAQVNEALDAHLGKSKK